MCLRRLICVCSKVMLFYTKLIILLFKIINNKNNVINLSFLTFELNIIPTFAVIAEPSYVLYYLLYIPTPPNYFALRT